MEHKEKNDSHVLFSSPKRKRFRRFSLQYVKKQFHNNMIYHFLERVESIESHNPSAGRRQHRVAGRMFLSALWLAGMHALA